MTRIDHTSHNHPATPAARAACRKNSKGFAEGDKVRQISGADVGALGVVTRINLPTMHYSDGTASNGEVRVTFEGIRFPKVSYLLAQAHLCIEKI